MLTPSVLLHLEREKERVIKSTRWLFQVETIFRETAMSTSFHAKAMCKKGKQIKSGPKSAGKDKNKEGNGDGKSKG